MKLYLCVWEDRHIDDGHSIHATVEGALGRLAEYQEAYDDTEWEEENVVGWVRAVRDVHDDGPSGYVKELELE